jgi:hypothetical protein
MTGAGEIMANDVRSQLLQAYNLIKDGRKGEAEDLLIGVLRDHETNADAWWLLANALNTPEEQREALEQVLTLRPADDKAQKMLAKINTLHPPPKAKPADDDPFADLLDDAPAKPKMSSDPFGDVSSSDDDPFAVVDQAAKRKPSPPPARSMSYFEEKPTPPKKTSPWLIAAVVVGVLAIASCGICAFVVQRGLVSFGEQMTTLVSDPTLLAAFNDPTLLAAFDDPTLAAAFAEGFGGGDGFTGAFASERLPGGLLSQGALLPNGNGSRGDIDMGDMHSWTFPADGGISYTVDAVAQNQNNLDIRVAIYGADNQLVGSNDDIDFGNNRDSRVTFTASQDGIYTIVIDPFSGSGDYTLTVRQG